VTQALSETQILNSNHRTTLLSECGRVGTPVDARIAATVDAARIAEVDAALLAVVPDLSFYRCLLAPKL